MIELNQNDIHLEELNPSTNKTEHQFLLSQEKEKMIDNSNTTGISEQFLKILRQNYLSSTIHLMEFEELEKQLNTHLATGISEECASNRLKLFGQNKMNHLDISLWKRLAILLISFSSIITILCEIGCLVVFSLSSEEYQSLFVAVISFLMLISIQTARAVCLNKIEVLLKQGQEMNQPTCLVRRGKIDKVIKTSELVLGDIIFLKSGQTVPADIRLGECNNLFLDLFEFTGEYESRPACSYKTNTNIIETPNMAFSSSICTSGDATGIVVATGDQTLIVSLLNNGSYLNKKTQSKQRAKLNKQTQWLMFGELLLMIIILIGIYKRYNISHYFLTTIGLSLCIFIMISYISIHLSFDLSIQESMLKLLQDDIFIRSLSSLEGIADMHYLLAEKTKCLSTNQMTVKNLYFNKTCFSASQFIASDNPTERNMLLQNETFYELYKAAILTQQVVLNSSKINTSSDFAYCPFSFQGMSSEISLTRFFSIVFKREANFFRDQFIPARQPDGNKSIKQFTGMEKYDFIVIKEVTDSSNFSLYLKGGFEIVRRRCSTILINNEVIPLNRARIEELEKQQSEIYNQGVRLVALAKKVFDKRQYPLDFKFYAQPTQHINFEFNDLIFIGFISLYDPPIPSAKSNLNDLKKGGIKVILTSNDHDLICQCFAREIGLIPEQAITNIDMKMMNEGISKEEQDQRCDAIVVNLMQEYEEEVQIKQIQRAFKKEYQIFARLSRPERRSVLNELQNFALNQTIGMIENPTAFWHFQHLSNVEVVKFERSYPCIGGQQSKETKNESDIISKSHNYSFISRSLLESNIMKNKRLISIQFITSITLSILISFIIALSFPIPIPLSPASIVSILLVSLLLQIGQITSQDSEITNTNFKQFNFNIVSMKAKIVFFFCQLAFISASGFLNYITVMNYYGISTKSLISLESSHSYPSPKDDFSSHLNQNTNEYDPYVNLLLSPQCSKDNTKETFSFSWYEEKFIHYDLRKTMLRCNSQTSSYSPSVNWSKCLHHSPPCFSTDVLNYSQTGFFLGTTMLIIFNSIGSRTIVNSTFSLRYSKQLLIGQIVSVLYVIGLVSIASSFKLLGIRLLPFLQFGFPAIPLCLAHLIYSEGQKYLSRKSKWFFKYSK